MRYTNPRLLYFTWISIFDSTWRDKAINRYQQQQPILMTLLLTSFYQEYMTKRRTIFGCVFPSPILSKFSFKLADICRSYDNILAVYLVSGHSGWLDKIIIIIISLIRQVGRQQWEKIQIKYKRQDKQTTITSGQSNLTKSATRGPIPRLGVTPGGRKLYHWIPGVGFPISVP